MFILNSALHEKKSRKLPGKVHVFPGMLFNTMEGAKRGMESLISSDRDWEKKRGGYLKVYRQDDTMVHIVADTYIKTYRITDDDPED